MTSSNIIIIRPVQSLLHYTCGGIHHQDFLPQQLSEQGFRLQSVEIINQSVSQTTDGNRILILLHKYNVRIKETITNHSATRNHLKEKIYTNEQIQFLRSGPRPRHIPVSCFGIMFCKHPTKDTRQTADMTPNQTADGKSIRRDLWPGRMRRRRPSPTSQGSFTDPYL